MGIVQQVRLNQRFIIIGVYSIPQFFQHRFVPQTADRVNVVNPGIQYGQTVNQTFGIGTEVRLPQFEFRTVQRRFQQFLVDPFHRNFLQVMVQRFHKGILLPRLAAAGADGENILPHAAAHAPGNILGHTGVQQCTAQGSSFRLQQHVFQKAQGHDGLLVPHVSCYDLHFMEGHGFCGGAFRNRIGSLELRRFGQRLLQGNFGMHLPCLRELFQIAVQMFQRLFNIHIPIQVDEGILRTVIGFMEIDKVFLGQLRNGSGQTARFKPVSGIREENFLPIVFQIGIRGRIYAFHLIVDNAIVLQKVIGILQFVMPAFLLQGKFIFIDKRIKYRVQIHVHQVVKIFIVAAGHRVDRLVRIGHGV